MGTRSIIKGYKKPKSAAELARAILFAIEEDFNLDVDRSEDWFQMAGWGGRLEVETKWEGVTVVIQGEMKRGDCWEYIDAMRRQLIYAWERAGSPDPAALTWEPAVNGFRPVTKFQRPTTPAELLQTIRTFCESEFRMPVGGLSDSDGLEIDLSPGGGDNLVRLECGRHEDFIESADLKTVSYRKPRTPEEFVDVLAAMATNELGMEVVTRCDEEDDPEPWIRLSLDGLDREAFTDVYLAILKGNGLLTVVDGEGELEVLKRYRERVATLDLDETSRNMLVDYMPEGYTLDMLTEDEAKALADFREGKSKPRRKAKVGPRFEPAAN